MLTLLSVSPSESQNNNRNLLCRLEQERRRREVEEKYISREKTPVFAKPYRVMGVGCRLEGEEEGGLGPRGELCLLHGL